MSKRIAIVEDDPDQRANYADAITKKGYEVVAFASRQEAIDGFEEELPDLAILDIILGNEVDAGFQICRDLLSRAPSLPVIFLTERINEIVNTSLPALYRACDENGIRPDPGKPIEVPRKPGG